jgi:hypothetical protein
VSDPLWGSVSLSSKFSEIGIEQCLINFVESKDAEITADKRHKLCEVGQSGASASRRHQDATA